MAKTGGTKAKPEKVSDGEALSFEAALHRLDEIVSQLEQADAPLDKALTLYEEGVTLARFCSKQLQDAERRVEVLEDKNGQLRGRPLVDDPEEDDTDSEEYDDDTTTEDEDEDEAPAYKRPGNSQDTLF